MDVCVSCFFSHLNIHIWCEQWVFCLFLQWFYAGFFLPHYNYPGPFIGVFVLCFSLYLVARVPIGAQPQLLFSAFFKQLQWHCIVFHWYLLFPFHKLAFPCSWSEFFVDCVIWYIDGFTFLSGIYITAANLSHFGSYYEKPTVDDFNAIICVDNAKAASFLSWFLCVQ